MKPLEGSLLALLVALGVAPLLQAQQTPLTIAGITARPGERATGFLVVPAAAGDTGTRLPLSILRGKTAGPTLALIGGTHGSEVAPIVALQRVAVIDEMDFYKVDLKLKIEY